MRRKRMIQLSISAIGVTVSAILLFNNGVFKADTTTVTPEPCLVDTAEVECVTQSDVDNQPQVRQFIVPDDESDGNLDGLTEVKRIDTNLDGTALKGAPYYLKNSSQNRKTYRLAENIVTKGTAFALINDNITLDLNGHTITYDDEVHGNIINGDLENGTSNWDFTTTEAHPLSEFPNLIEGKYINLSPAGQPANGPKVFINRQIGPDDLTNPENIGGHAFEFKVGTPDAATPPPPDHQYVDYTNTITLEPHTQYDLSFMALNGVGGNKDEGVDSNGNEISHWQNNNELYVALLDENGQEVIRYKDYFTKDASGKVIGVPVRAIKNGTSNRGFTFESTTFNTLDQTTFKLRVGVAHANRDMVIPKPDPTPDIYHYGKAYIDNIQIQRHKAHGIVIGATNTENWPTRNITYPDVTQYGSAKDSIVENGTLIQGRDAGNRSMGIHGAGDNTEIANMTITVAGPNTRNIDSVALNLKVHDNTLNNDVLQIHSRDNFDGVVMSVNSIGGDVYGNHINGGPQLGIVVGNGKNSYNSVTQKAQYDAYRANQIANRIKIRNNTISLNTRYTNDFAIMAYSVVGAEITGNEINCSGDLLENGGVSACRGIYSGGGSDTLLITGNTIDVQELPINQESGNNGRLPIGCEANYAGGGAYGIQLESSNNITIGSESPGDRNFVTAHANRCPANAMRLNFSTSNRNIKIEGNTFKAIRDNINNDNTNTEFLPTSEEVLHASALKFDEGINTANQQLTFKNNRLETNDRWLSSFNISNLELIGTEFVKDQTNPITNPFEPLIAYRYNRDTVADGMHPIKDIRFIDNKFPDASSREAFESAYLIAKFYRTLGTDPLSSFYVGHTYTLTVQGPDGPIAGANVSIKDKDGAEILPQPSVTNNNGNISAALNQYKHIVTDKNANPKYESKSIDLSQYTVSISAPGYKNDDASNFSFNISESTKEKTVTLNAANDTSMPSLSAGSPSGTLPVGTTSQTLKVSTNENSTCKYSTTPSTDYFAMAGIFTTTGGTTHTAPISSLSNGNTYQYYVRCTDSSNNKNSSDYSISFSVANPAVTPNPDPDPDPDPEPNPLPDPVALLNPTRFASGWNMVAFPDSAGSSGDDILPDSFRLRSFSTAANAYLRGESNDIKLTPGMGYWLRIDDMNKVNNLSYKSRSFSETEVSVSKGWNLLGNPWDMDLPLSNLSVKYKDGAVRSYQDAINRRDVSGYVWSYDGNANPKQYYFVAISPDKYRTTAQKKTTIGSFRGFWMIVRSSEVSGIVMKR